MEDRRRNIVFRFGILYLLIVGAFVMVIAKIVIIQTTERDEWLALHERNAVRANVEVPAQRGNIYSADGRLMASTIPTYRVFMDMRVPALKKDSLFYKNVNSLSISLANLFGDKSAVQYRNELTNAFRNGNGRHPVFPREISHAQWIKLQTFPLFRLNNPIQSGLIHEVRERRVKPFGSLASRTIGDIHIDERGGRSGLERAYNEALTGKPGIGRRLRIRNTNQWRTEVGVQPVDGMDVITTIDIDIQDIAENELIRTLRANNAQSGYAIVMETKTGEVKAIVNMYRDASGGFHEKVNGVLTDMMEPGSTFKTMILMALLDDGKVKLTDEFDTGNGRFSPNSRIPEITDHNYQRGGFGRITAAQVLYGSSNIGMHKMVHDAYRNNPGALVDKLRAMNFATSVELEIFGAGEPFIRHPREENTRWSQTSLSSISRGYDIQIPPIYMLMYYNAIANNGQMVKPMFVKSINRDGQVVRRFRTETINRSIAKRSTIEAIQETLLGVVEDERYGTANRHVYSDTVRIAGKTGTARMTDAQGNYTNRHRVSFVGYFPADNPQYTAIVVVNQPAIASPSAGQISGGVFKNIAHRTMALKANRTPQTVADNSTEMSNISLLPNSTNGRFQELRTVNRGLRIPMSGESSEWIRTAVTENEIQIQPLNFSEGQIPDVRGMGAKDAVFLLEKLGLNVQLNGRGKIVSQNINPDRKTIVLTLK